MWWLRRWEVSPPIVWVSTPPPHSVLSSGSAAPFATAFTEQNAHKIFLLYLKCCTYLLIQKLIEGPVILTTRPLKNQIVHITNIPPHHNEFHLHIISPCRHIKVVDSSFSDLPLRFQLKNHFRHQLHPHCAVPYCSQGPGKTQIQVKVN